MRKKRNIVLILIVILVAAILTILLVHHKDKTTSGSHSTASSSTINKTGSSSNPKTIRLIATGDWIAHDSVNAAAKQSDGSYDYLPMVSDFAPLFKTADIRFCNDPILNGGAVGPITGYPKFNSPPDFVSSMNKLGCNLVGTASNHSFDFTQANITASVQAWQKQPNMLAVAGQNSGQAEHDTIHYFTIKGVKIAFLAYTSYINTDAPVQNDYGVNVFSQAFAKQQLQEAKQNGAEVTIVSMRWGTEYSTTVNAEQKADAQFLADNGASLILGHGSHELQTVQQLNGADGQKVPVWYSLGNFLNTQEPPETLFNGIAVMDIATDTKAVTIKGYAPVYMRYSWTAAQAAADDTNARTNLHLYYLQDATQAMIDGQQLKTTVDAQKARMTSTLSADGLNIPLLDSKQAATN